MKFVTLEVVFALVALVSPSFQQPFIFNNPFVSSTRKGPSPSSLKNTSALMDETRVGYYHDQTVALVDLGPNNQLRSCNLFEVFEPIEGIELLKNLSIYNPQFITFDEMIKLMQRCELMDKLEGEISSAQSTNITKKQNNGGVGWYPIRLFSAILPGTKWCGPGDTAENYHDLGEFAIIDRCCRAHDLCPIKVRSNQSRYNLTNNSLYTKSHCTCDETFYKCLKSTSLPMADVMGNIYFNILKVQCIEITSMKHTFSLSPMWQFSRTKRY